MNSLNSQPLDRALMKKTKAAISFRPALLYRLFFAIGLRRPVLPQQAGMTIYQEKSAFELDADGCPCDLNFLEYLKHFKIQGKSIFHFGTGVHHVIGLENQAFDRPNEIVATTAAAPEHQAYVRFVLKNPELAKYYKVLFADIYTLTANTVPCFDFVTLFHLCEFYLAENAAKIHQTDGSLLQLFIDKLNPNGKILFYQGSYGWSETKSIVDAFEAAGKLKRVDEYKSLLIYAKA